MAKRCMYTNGWMQCRWWLPSTVTNTRDHFIFRLTFNRFQWHATSVTRNDITVTDRTLSLLFGLVLVTNQRNAPYLKHVASSPSTCQGSIAVLNSKVTLSSSRVPHTGNLNSKNGFNQLSWKSKTCLL